MRLIYSLVLVVFLLVSFVSAGYDEELLTVDDLLFVVSQLGAQDFDVRADYSGSGSVDLFDLVLVASHLGSPRFEARRWLFETSPDGWHELWLANQPEGWEELFSDDFESYPQQLFPATATTDRDSLAPWSVRVPLPPDPEQNRYGAIVGVSSPLGESHAWRAHYGEGHPQGFDAARLSHWTLSQGNPGGFYVAVIMRLSEDWGQDAIGAYTPKHSIVRVTLADTGEDIDFGWNGWRVNPYGSGYQMGWRAERPRRNLDNFEAAGVFETDEWILLEWEVGFNTNGSHTGHHRGWLNGELIQESFNEDFPYGVLSGVNMAGGFGGALGFAPNDQWYDVDRIYFSTPSSSQT